MSNELPDIKTANQAMVLAFEHYQLQRDILLRKLKHAQAATKESLLQTRQVLQNQNDEMPEEFREVEEYDALWQSAIELFESTYVPESDLKKIENLLSSIPQLIKKYYDALLSQDVELQELIKKQEAEKYKEALKLIKDIQNRPCPMSGLDPSEFDIDLIATQGKMLGFFPARRRA